SALLRHGNTFMKNKNQQSQLDLVSPLVEVFHDILVIFFEVGKELFKWAWINILKKEAPLEQIDRKALFVDTNTEIQDALGTDTKSLKDFLLKDIDFRRHSFIVGASGFGKTNLISILQEHSVRRDKPIIFFDPKGDMEALTTFQNICKQYKKPCYIFSEHYKDSISLNPVLEGTINQVVDRIMRSF